MTAFPKPLGKPRKRTVASLKAHYSRVAAMPSCVSGKGPVVLHHVPVTSPKSRQAVRKRGSARAAVVPLTQEEHEWLHACGGERAFEHYSGLPAGYLVGVALALLSETVTGS